MPVNLKRKQAGLTLIEIMIALLLGLIVIGGALSIYISTIRSSTDITNSARLNYDLDSVMQFIVNDVRRAGYWAGGVAESKAENSPTNPGNPFTIGTANIQIPESSCILYTYDADADGILDDSATDVDTIGPDEDEPEYYGFKLENGELKVRSSKIADNDCTGDGWETITDSNKIEITHLQFSFLPIAAQAAVANVHPALAALSATTRCLNSTPSPDESFDTTCALANDAGDIATNDLAAEKRVINIIISGRIENDHDVIKTISSSVQVKTPRIYKQL